jgi:hypothetical protein
LPVFVILLASEDREGQVTIDPEGHLDKVRQEVLDVVPKRLWEPILTELVLLDWLSGRDEITLEAYPFRSRRHKM